jgi:Concanavalin A-like lectin/glucanases superfamily
MKTLDRICLRMLRQLPITAVLIAALATASATAAAAPPVMLPVEVLGPVGTTRTVTVDTISATNTLSLRLHGVAHARMIEVKVDNRAWIPLTNTTATVSGLARRYGGIGGAFTTLDMRVPLAAPALSAGSHTIAFRFAIGDGITIGFRVLRLNLLDANGQPAVLASGFAQDDPSTWSAPRPSAADRTAGEALWRNATIIDRPGGPPIRARCSDCHAQNGHDLAYFNFSNQSIIERSVFHGLSTLQGEQIASYIRSLPGSINGRPWNPPYQPGPGLDARPVSEWAAGAGIDAVLAEDAEGMASLPFLSNSLRLMVESPTQRSAVSVTPSVPVELSGPRDDFFNAADGLRRDVRRLQVASGQSPKTADASAAALPRISNPAVMPSGGRAGRLGVRALIGSDGRIVDIPVHELPIALQLLDWNHWLPRVHPLDVPNFDFNASAAKQQYQLLRQKLSAPDGEAFFYRSSDGPGRSFLFDGYGSAITDLKRAVIPSAGNPMTAVEANRTYSAALLGVTKMWEIMQEFDLEGRGRKAYGVTAPERLWYSNRFVFDTSPFLLGIPPSTTLIGDPQSPGIAFPYLSNAWYGLALQLNAGSGGRSSGGHGVIDWGYMAGFFGDLERASGEPEPVRRAIFAMVSMQQHDSGRGPEYGGDGNPGGNGWDIATSPPGLMNWSASYWRKVPQSKPVVQALLHAVAEKNGRYTPAQWALAKGHDGGVVPPPNYVLGTDQGEAFERNIAERYLEALVAAKTVHGVDEPVRNGLAAVGALIWSNNNWSVHRSATAAIAAPAQCVATSGAGSIQIDWSAVPGATSYNLYRAVSATGPFAPLQLMTTNTTAIDRGLNAGSTWYYRVSANVNGAEGPRNSPVASASASTGLVARWAFDETRNAFIADTSGQGNHGELIGGAQRIVGKKGGGIRATAPRQFASVPLDLSRYLDRNNVTVTAWVRSSTLPTGYEKMVILGQYARFGVVGSDGKIGVRVGDDGEVFSARSVIDGQWHHVAMSRRSNGAISIWIDGVLSSSGQITVELVNLTTPVHNLGRSGYWNGGDTSWLGDLDDIRIYDRILNGPEVVSVMADQSLGQSSVEGAEAIAPSLVHAAIGSDMRPQQAVVVAPALNRSSSGATTRASAERRAGGSSVVAALALLSLLAIWLSLRPGLAGSQWATTLLQKLRAGMGLANLWR